MPDEAKSTPSRTITRETFDGAKSEITIYTAGLFEGEGCISIRRSRTRRGGWQVWLAVVIKMADSEPLHELQWHWGGSVRPGGEKRLGRTSTEQWCVVARQAAAFLRDIAPHLRSAKRRAAVSHALAFQAQKRPSPSQGHGYAEEQERFRLEMKRLNQRVAA